MAGEVIIADDREPESAASRLEAYGFSVAVSRLDAGDYALFPHDLVVLIERKTISNLLGSLSTKQMVSQAHKLVESSDIAFLLREGAFRRNAGGTLEYYSPKDPRAHASGWVVSGWSWDSFSGMMLDLQLMGIIIDDYPVLGEYPYEIARIATNLYKEDHRWVRERQRPTVLSIDKQYETCVWSLCAFQGVGVDWAQTFLREFGNVSTVIDVATKYPALLSEVKCGKSKFGMKRAHRLNEEITQSYKGD